MGREHQRKRLDILFYTSKLRVRILFKFLFLTRTQLYVHNKSRDMNLFSSKTKKFQKGFTLIELLIVIAILGVLAAAVLVALNPLEQLARARDGGRKSAISQLGNSVQAYYTSQNGTYPTANATWLTTLVTSGELKSAPTNPAGGVACATNIQNGYCYNTAGTDAIAFSTAESTTEKIKSTGTGAVCATTAWIVWSSADGKTGLVCQAAAPAVGITGLK